MDWKALFKAQAELDKHILQEKGLEGQDLLDMKILALQVEIGELANEQRTWKFWSDDREPRTEVICHCCNGEGGFYLGDELESECTYCDATGIQEKNRLLEEFVDCLHFILSIGNHIGVKSFEPIKLISLTNDITGQFNAVFKLISKWEKIFLFMDRDSYHIVVNELLKLGEMLGFTEDQIEQAYWDKNEINHKRQESNY